MEQKPAPHIDKFVGRGNNDPEAKKVLKNYLTHRFEHSKERYNDELEKTETDLFIIDLAQKAVDEILSKYGRKELIYVPTEHVHIFDKGWVEEFTNGKFANGVASTINGDFLIERFDTLVDFVLAIFHELVHIKSFTAVQATHEGDESRLTEYRSGFSVKSRDGSTRYFTDFNEAIVGLLTKQFYEEYVRGNEFFKEEIKDIDAGKFIANTTRLPEVAELLKYIDELYEKNKDKYSREEILAMFLDAGINGNLLKIGKLVESTFGKGSFRELGEKSIHNRDQKNLVD